MDKIWINSYEPNINYDISLNTFSSLVDCFNDAVSRFSNSPAFSNFGVSLTYLQVKELADNFASFLQYELKLQKSNKIGIMMPNVLQYPVVMFGALQAGLVVVNINPLYTPRELEHQLKDSGTNTIVILENFANILELVINNTQVKNIIIASIGDLLGLVKGTLMNFVLRKIKKIVPNYNFSKSIKFNQAIKLGKEKKFTSVEIGLEDDALLQYTGGTTGVAKGAMLTHGNLCANILQLKEWLKNVLVRIETTNIDLLAFSPLPVCHIFACLVNIFFVFNIGAHTVLITNPKNLPALVKEMNKYKIIFITGVNTLFNALVHNEEFKKLDFSTWKICLGGGISVQKAVAEKWQQITGQVLLEGYGLTESSPVVSVNPIESKIYQGNIGLPLPLTDVQIKDNNGNELPIGEIGELYVKGPQVMKGYWNNPQETKNVLQDGWLATGDMATINEKGFIKIVDRKKDMIIISGFNVYPNEIEEVVAMHPKIKEVACIGVPSDKTGEAIKLYIVIKNNESLTEDEIISFCGKSLTRYKVPKLIEFRDELPKSNVGKILRKKLKEENK